jgi:uncharacterized protein (TIGR03435 family)
MTLVGLVLSALLVVPKVLGQGVAANPTRDDKTVANAAPGGPDYVPTMTFDVASVRESKQDPNQPHRVGGAFQPHSTNLNLENVQLYYMITMAYGVQVHQVQDIPNWGWTSFNIQAKSDSEADGRLAKLDDANAKLEQQHMLQALLADRFHLQVHWSTVERPVYHLVVAKGGPKLLPAGSMSPGADESKWLGDHEVPPLHQQGDGQRGYIFYGHNCPIQNLARMLSSQMGRDVVDQTGLMGKFDFRLQYSGRTADDNPKDDPSKWPPMMDAVEDQLGLKLESAKGEVELLTVDHVEMPTEN